MKHIQLLKRYILCLAGLFILSIGIALCLHSGLGSSPISSIPYVLSCYFAPSMGTFVIIMHCIYIMAQIAILGKKFRLVQLLQLPISLAFGFFNDIAMNLLDFLQPETLLMQILTVILGCTVMACGLVLQLCANIIMVAGEAIIAVIADALHKKFGNVKICFDSCAVILSLILSYCFFGTLFEHGIGLGTAISALLVGTFVKAEQKILIPLCHRFIGESSIIKETR